MPHAAERRVAAERLAATLFDRRRHAFRSRVARLHAAHSYRSVLALVGATFLFASVAGDGTWTASVLLVLESVTLAVAVWTSGLARVDSHGLIGLLVAATTLAIALLFADSSRFTGIAGIATGVLIIATIAAIAIGVVDQDEVNAHSITGAVCVYLLFGLLFVFLYSAVAVLGSGAFFAQGTDGTRALRLYFSYVTLATLGYGDYTPAGDLGHTLAVLEALVGQLYLVTVLALLVSRLRGRTAD
jgi:voltage-gated potassium channel